MQLKIVMWLHENDNFTTNMKILTFHYINILY